MQELKNNPIITILLGLLVAAISILGMMNNAHLSNLQTNMNHSFDQLWNKLDRVTVFMNQKEESIRQEQRTLKEELICIGKEVERVKAHQDIGKKSK